MPRRALACVAVSAACAASAGCSTGVQAGDTATVRSTVRVLLRLCAEGRSQDIPDVLATPAQKVYIDAGGGPRAGCMKVLRAPADAAVALPAASVTGVRVNGDVADVGVALGTARATVEAERHGDRWLVTNRAF